MKVIITLFATFLFFIFPNKETVNAPQTPAQGVVMPPLDCTTPTSNVEKIVCLANAFKATLTTAQITSLEIAFTTTTQARWSNLPGGISIRNGLEFSTLSAAQLTAALAVITAAAGTAADDGYAEFAQIRAADAYLGTQGGGNGYSDGKYIIAFLGTPSLTGKWLLQFGGHHYAQNITFNGGKVIGVTPEHQGVEPLSFTNTSTVRLKVFDLLGREIVNLNNGTMTAGSQNIVLNTANGVKINQGSYIYQLTVDNNNGTFSQSKMLFVQ